MLWWAIESELPTMPPGDEWREASAVLVTDEATSKCQYPGNLCSTVQNRNAIGKFTVIGWLRFFFMGQNKSMCVREHEFWALFCF